MLTYPGVPWAKEGLSWDLASLGSSLGRRDLGQGRGHPTVELGAPAAPDGEESHRETVGAEGIEDGEDGPGRTGKFGQSGQSGLAHWKKRRCWFPESILTHGPVPPLTVLREGESQIPCGCWIALGWALGHPLTARSTHHHRAVETQHGPEAPCGPFPWLFHERICPTLGRL